MELKDSVKVKYVIEKRASKVLCCWSVVEEDGDSFGNLEAARTAVEILRKYRGEVWEYRLLEVTTKEL